MHAAGMPEEMHMVETAVRQKFVMVTLGPLLTGSYFRCYEKFWPPEDGVEVPEVVLSAPQPNTEQDDEAHPYSTGI